MIKLLPLTMLLLEVFSETAAPRIPVINKPVSLAPGTAVMPWPEPTLVKVMPDMLPDVWLARLPSMVRLDTVMLVLPLVGSALVMTPNVPLVALGTRRILLAPEPLSITLLGRLMAPVMANVPSSR